MNKSQLQTAIQLHPSSFCLHPSDHGVRGVAVSARLPVKQEARVRPPSDTPDIFRIMQLPTWLETERRRSRKPIDAGAKPVVGSELVFGVEE